MEQINNQNPVFEVQNPAENGFPTALIHAKVECVSEGIRLSDSDADPITLDVLRSRIMEELQKPAHQLATQIMATYLAD